MDPEPLGADGFEPSVGKFSPSLGKDDPNLGSEDNGDCPVVGVSLVGAGAEAGGPAEGPAEGLEEGPAEDLDAMLIGEDTRAAGEDAAAVLREENCGDEA